jgi:hypothetical protein
MQPDGKLADALRVVIYGTLGLAFFLFASNDRAPDWMPWSIGAIFFVAVGYCARGWREAKWKLVLRLLPGILAALLLLSWYGIQQTALSSVNVGSWSVHATQLGLTSTANGMRMYGFPGWTYDIWRSHIQMGFAPIPASANTPGASHINFAPTPGWTFYTPKSQPVWVLPKYTTSVFIPIWSPVAILSIPTLFWTLVILMLWIWKRFRELA